MTNPKRVNVRITVKPVLQDTSILHKVSLHDRCPFITGSLTQDKLDVILENFQAISGCPPTSVPCWQVLLYTLAHRLLFKPSLSSWIYSRRTVIMVIYADLFSVWVIRLSQWYKSLMGKTLLSMHDYLAPHRGRARYCNAHVCLSVCLCVCPCFRKISKCNISAISQPIIMKLGIHITYGYTVTDKYFQNFRSKVKVVGRRKAKNVIWPYLGNEWS